MCRGARGVGEILRYALHQTDTVKGTDLEPNIR